MEYAIIAQNGRNLKDLGHLQIISTDDSRERAHRLFIAHKSRFKRLGFKEKVNEWLYENAIATATLAKDDEAIRFVLMTKEDAEKTIRHPFNF